MRRAACIDGKVVLAQRADVTDGAIDHEALHAEALGVRCHDLAHERLCEVAAAIDHEYVAGAAKIERAMNREVVARAGAHGHGGPGHRLRLVIGQKSYRAAYARHVVAQ